MKAVFAAGVVIFSSLIARADSQEAQCPHAPEVCAKACSDYGDFLADLVEKKLISCQLAAAKLKKGDQNLEDVVNCADRNFCK